MASTLRTAVETTSEPRVVVGTTPWDHEEVGKASALHVTVETTFETLAAVRTTSWPCEEV